MLQTLIGTQCHMVEPGDRWLAKIKTIEQGWQTIKSDCKTHDEANEAVVKWKEENEIHNQSDS